jgi:hypothetical protein
MKMTREQLAELSAAERQELLRHLVELGGQPSVKRNPRARRRFLAFMAICVVVLLIWIVTLGLTLPPDERTDQWRLAWVGFDVAELLAFTVTGWAAWRGRQLLIPSLLVLGTLLFCDAWFDVVLSWNSDERWGSLASAIVVEVPLGILFWLLARRLVLGTVAAARARVGLAGPPPVLHRLRLFWPLAEELDKSADTRLEAAAVPVAVNAVVDPVVAAAVDPVVSTVVDTEPQRYPAHSDLDEVPGPS